MLLLIISMAMPKLRKKAMRKLNAAALVLAAAAIFSAAPALADDFAVKTPQLHTAPAVTAPQAPKAEMPDAVLQSKTITAEKAAQQQIKKAEDNLKKKVIEFNGQTATPETPDGIKAGM